MPTTATKPPPVEAGQSLELLDINWQQYTAIREALDDRTNLRFVYLDGSLEILVTSRRHDWHAERLGQLVIAVASGCGVLWEDAGTTTFRRQAKEAGIEGDKTFYLGANAERMKGSVEVDLETQAPPDLAVEVEVSHSANKAMEVWGRLGVPEVWRFDPVREKVGFWRRREDGTYEPIERSMGLPVLMPADVLEQLKLADSIGAAAWFARLNDWVRAVVLPRAERPA